MDYETCHRQACELAKALTLVNNRDALYMLNAATRLANRHKSAKLQDVYWHPIERVIVLRFASEPRCRFVRRYDGITGSHFGVTKSGTVVNWYAP